MNNPQPNERLFALTSLAEKLYIQGAKPIKLSHAHYIHTWCEKVSSAPGRSRIDRRPETTREMIS